MEPDQVVLRAVERLTLPGTAALEAPVHRIAEEAQVSLQVARRALWRMHAAGVLQIDEQRDRSGARLANVYTVLRHRA